MGAVLAVGLMHALHRSLAEARLPRSGPLMGLGPADRLAVARAVRSGERVADPRLGAATVNLARAKLRRSGSGLIIATVAILYFVGTAIVTRRRGVVVLAVVWGTYDVCWWIEALRLRPRARRAVELNSQPGG